MHKLLLPLLSLLFVITMVYAIWHTSVPAASVREDVYSNSVPSDVYAPTMNQHIDSEENQWDKPNLPTLP